VRKPVTDFDAAFATGTKANLERVERISLVAIAIGNHQSLDGKFPWVLHVCKRRFSDGPAGIFGQHRLRVEAFHVTQATVHKQPDDAPDAGRKMGLSIRRRPAGCRGIAVQHGSERHGAETEAGGTSGQCAGIVGVVGMVHGLNSGFSEW
jgi:hypothetical protein